MEICPSSNEVYNDVLRKCIPKTSRAGKVLSNPDNKRCKGQKVINPVSNRCVEKTNPTVRSILMMQEKDELARAKYIQKNSKKYDTRSRLMRNALVAINKIYRAWQKGKLNTNAEIQALGKEFNVLNQYLVSIPSMPHDRFYKEMVKIQRLEDEIITDIDFKFVVDTLMDRLSSGPNQHEIRTSFIKPSEPHKENMGFLQRARYIQKTSKKYDAQTRLIRNALVAIHKIHKAWQKGKLNTSAKIQALEKEFDVLNQYLVSISSMPHDKFYREIVKIQRLEDEIITDIDFKFVVDTLMDRLSSPRKESEPSISKQSVVHDKAPSSSSNFHSHKGDIKIQSTHNAQESAPKLIQNALVAIGKIHKAWQKGKLNTNAEIQALEKEFDVLNQYLVSIPSMPHDKFYREIVKIQRLEDEIITDIDFKLVVDTLMDRLLSSSPRKQSIPKHPIVQAKSSPIKSSPIKSSPIKSSPIKSSPIKSSPIKSSPIKSSPQQPVTQNSPSSNDVIFTDKVIEQFYQWTSDFGRSHEKELKNIKSAKFFECNAFNSLLVIYNIYKAWSLNDLERENLEFEFHALDIMLECLSKETYSREFMRSLRKIRSLQYKGSTVAKLYDFEMVMGRLYINFIDEEIKVGDWANAADESLSPLPSKFIDPKQAVNSPEKTKDDAYAWNEKNNEIFDASKTHMYNLIPKFQNGTNIEKRYVQHLEHVILSKYTPLLFARTLDDMKMNADMAYKAQSSSKKINDLSLFNCHDGQRKLTLGYLEFIAKSISDLRCAANDVFIIYAGSSGLASAIAATIFPDVMMAMYDPDPNTVKYLPKGDNIKPVIYRNTPFLPANSLRLSPLMVFTDKAGWFDDDVAAYGRDVLFPLSKRKHLLFVSDVRADTKETEIINDMKAQMRWTILLNCDYYMHKFRLPYYDSMDEIKTYKDMYENIDHLRPFWKSKQHLIKNFGHRNDPTSLLYIDGEMYIQPFGPQRTTEFRLIGKPNSLKKFAFRYYNVRRIENQAALFNNVYRGYGSYYYQNKDVTYMPPYVSSYEKITEFHILLSCLNTGQSFIKRDPYSVHKMRTMFDTYNNLMFEIVKIKPNITQCKYVSLQKSLRKRKENYHDVVPPYFDRLLQRKI